MKKNLSAVAEVFIRPFKNKVHKILQFQKMNI